MLPKILDQALKELYIGLEYTNREISGVLAAAAGRGLCPDCNGPVFLFRRPHKKYHVFDESGELHSCPAKTS